MADVNINKFRASVVRDGSKPASPGFIVSEGQDPVDPAGNGQNHLPVTIATAATGLSITDSQVLGGAGNVGQYIRGDGSLADFPQASGGGSSVSYYLNGSISQGTIGGVAYKELNKVPILGAGTDFTINADGYIASFLTDAGDPNLLEIPGGNWNFETYFSASSSGGSPSFYVELYKYDGTTFTLIASSSSSPELIAFGTNLNPYFSTLAVPTTTLALTDRLAIRYYVTHSGRTITLHTENNHLCQVVTTFTTGLTSLNGLTAQVQNLAVGTIGTDFNIASATATHTFNLPTASATNRGALSSADWTTFNNKQNALGYVPVPETRTITINGVSQDLSANRTYNVGTVTSVGLSSATSGVTIGSTPVTTSGTITIAIATASGSQNGLLSSTDWTTFNNKQNALTNPVTGTGTTNYLPKFTGASTIGNSIVSESSGVINIAGRLNVLSTYASDSAAQSVLRDNTGVALNFGGTASGFKWLQAQDSAGASTYYPILINPYGGNLLVGTTTDSGYKLDVNGTGRFSGNLTASGSGNIVIQAISSNNFPLFQLQDNRAGGNTWNIEGGRTLANLQFRSSIAGGTVLELASTGAATFSSTVRINADGQSLLIFPTTTNSVRMQIQSTGGGNLVVGTENSTGGILATGTNAYASVFTSGSTRDLVLGTNSTARLTINGTSGNVLINSNMGIGTGFTPAYPLHIYTSVADWGVVVQNLNASSYGMYVRGGATNGSTSAFFVANTAGTTLLDIKGSGAAYFLSSVNVNGAADISGHLIVRGTLPADQTDAAVIDHFSNTMRIFSYGAAGVTGDFQFRTAAGGAGSNLVSTINGTTGAYTAVSDVNKKKDFEESTIGLDAILGLKPTLYRMKSETNTEKHLGFIAQEVRQYIPNAYVENGEFIGLNEMPIIAALVKSIQELNEKIK